MKTPAYWRQKLAGVEKHSFYLRTSQNCLFSKKKCMKTWPLWPIVAPPALNAWRYNSGTKRVSTNAISMHNCRIFWESSQNVYNKLWDYRSKLVPFSTPCRMLLFEPNGCQKIWDKPELQSYSMTKFHDRKVKWASECTLNTSTSTRVQNAINRYSTSACRQHIVFQLTLLTVMNSKLNGLSVIPILFANIETCWSTIDANMASQVTEKQNFCREANFLQL